MILSLSFTCIIIVVADDIVVVVKLDDEDVGRCRLVPLVANADEGVGFYCL